MTHSRLRLDAVGTTGGKATVATTDGPDDRLRPFLDRVIVPALVDRLRAELAAGPLEMPMQPKQEPRPAYHRRQDLARLRLLAADLPVVVDDDGRAYTVALPPPSDTVLQRGRYQVIVAYLVGWRHARAHGLAAQTDPTAQADPATSQRDGASGPPSR